jgi:uncharacterized protein YdaU (DUF1376 family)
MYFFLALMENGISSTKEDFCSDGFDLPKEKRLKKAKNVLKEKKAEKEKTRQKKSLLNETEKTNTLSSLNIGEKNIDMNNTKLLKHTLKKVTLVIQPTQEVSERRLILSKKIKGQLNK